MEQRGSKQRKSEDVKVKRGGHIGKNALCTKYYTVHKKGAKTLYLNILFILVGTGAVLKERRKI
jgi:hypothetical protein